MSLQAGTQLGDYRILSKIGEGASGKVYEGQHLLTQRRDALKVLTGGGLHIPEEDQRFLREIQVQASLNHPNIAAVHNAFSTPHGLVLAMELARGEPLNVILARGRLPRDRGVAVILEMLAGLSYAHAAGVVHRDIKPGNLIVTPDWSVKLTDFGLARSVDSPHLTQAGVFAGSPSYMAPEQAHGTIEADARSDTYSAGVLLYEVVTGRLPFVEQCTFDVLMAHQKAQPRPPSELDPTISAELNRVMLKALEKDPGQRYQTAGEFHAALRKLAAPPAPRRVPAKPWAMRIALTAAASALLALGASQLLSDRRPIAPPLPPSPPPYSAAGVPQDVPAPLPVASDTSPTIPNAQPPQSKVPVRARRNPPPAPTRLQITGSLPDPPIRPAGTIPPPRFASTPDPEALPASPPLPVPVAQAAPAPAVNTDPAVPSPPKHHNVVVRALQRVVNTFRDSPPSRQR